MMNLASRSERLFAQIVDGLIALLPVAGVGLVVLSVPSLSDLTAGWMFIAAILACASYVIFADALPGGQSIGKRALGIAVVDGATGRPCSVGQSFVRNLLLAILGFFDWIFILGETRRRLGDMAAGTLVVDADHARL